MIPPAKRDVSRGGPVRSLLAAAFVAALALSMPGCQDNEIDENQVCAFQCDYTDPAAALTVEDVVQVIANAIVEANANGIRNMTVSVNDHLNNVLAVFDTESATFDYSLISARGNPNSESQGLYAASAASPTANFVPLGARDALNTALDGIFIPAGYAAISKAGTANYFSTQGNAFSTRTANTLIQQNFVPGETDRPGGPLFGVQIAQLVCSDINTRQSVSDQTNTTGASDIDDLIGPRRLPVGFAADPGGLPLYKDGIPELDAFGNQTGRRGKVVVGSVGIEFNGIYSRDPDATDQDRNLEERIAVAATRGFEADRERQANRITVAGRALRFFDDGARRAASSSFVDVPPTVANGAGVAIPGASEAFLNALSGTTGDFVNDRFFFPFDEPRRGVNFLTPESGVVPETFVAPAAAAAQGLQNARGEKLIDSAGADRYPATASLNPLPGAGGLSTDDVQELLVNALLLAERTRAQTRTPLGGQARIDVAVVDLDGNVLGFARSQDALLDGVDVTIAKTRQAAFWSKANARQQLEAALDPLGNAGLLNTRTFDAYIDTAANFLGLPISANPADEPFAGAFAWSSIALGGIANPDFPPGVLDANEGPLSRREGEWSIFSTGIQTELVLPGIALGLCEEVPDLASVLSQLPGAPPIADPYDVSVAGDAARVIFCETLRNALIGSPDPGQQLTCIQDLQDGGAGLITGLQNGFHIFQGAVPIYRGNQLIGAFGVSGDGAEQDDFVPFVSLDLVNRNQRNRNVPGPIGNAPKNIRADNISVQNINLRYVVCPPAPFRNSNEQNGCDGR